MKKIPLKVSFFLALFIALFGTALFPHFRLLAFAPFLALLYWQSSFVFSLWIAFLCGLIIDLISSELRFGIYAFNYCLTTLLIYHQKRHFFEDKSLAFPLFTALISCISTALHLFLLYAFDKELPLSLKLVVSDLIGMPLLDALYAFLWFTCPVQCYQYIQRKGLRSIFFKKEEQS